MDQLQLELDKVKQELKSKNEECASLETSHAKMSAELEDLTTSLFEEANKMVYEANMRRHKAEKKLAAAQGQIDALQIEIDALKALVITSTPSNPNSLQVRKKKEEKTSMFPASPLRFGNKSPRKEENKSHHHMNGNPSSSPNTPTKHLLRSLNKEVELGFYSDFKTWFKLRDAEPGGDGNHFCQCFRAGGKIADDDGGGEIALHRCETLVRSSLLGRVLRDDVLPCINFTQKPVAEKLSQSIHKNTLSMELLPCSDTMQKCSLSGIVTSCKYRIRLNEDPEWLAVSQSARNRITTVCDFFTYLRYVKQGIVKHAGEQIYAEIVQHRLKMSLARLGYRDIDS